MKGNMDNGESTLAFTPIAGYDASEIPPEAPEGEWTAAFKVSKKSATQEGGFPMLTLDITLESTDDEDNKWAEGTHLRDWIVLYPQTGLQGKQQRAARIAKQRLANLSDTLGFDLNVIPRNINSWDDLDGLVNAIDGQRGTVVTRNRSYNGETRTNVTYVSPRD